MSGDDRGYDRPVTLTVLQRQAVNAISRSIADGGMDDVTALYCWFQGLLVYKRTEDQIRDARAKLFTAVEACINEGLDEQLMDRLEVLHQDPAFRDRLELIYKSLARGVETSAPSLSTNQQKDPKQ